MINLGKKIKIKIKNSRKIKETGTGDFKNFRKDVKLANGEQQT